ncbi:MAG: HD domain-containing protein [Oscillospiraceae bacterium]
MNADTGDILAIDRFEIIGVIKSALTRIDPRIVEHGERVAYIVGKMLDEAGVFDRKVRKELFILSYFHDIGAYKTDEIDRMLEFETVDGDSHSIYGYIFLKNMSPVGDCAKAILYHHTPYEELVKTGGSDMDYAAFIAVADRADILMSGGKRNFEVFTSSPKKFSPQIVQLFLKAEKNRDISSSIISKDYGESIEKRIKEYSPEDKEVIEYLKMLIYSIDFHSEQTVTHTIITMAISVELAKRLKLSQMEISELYIGALLHDIGKIAIPARILESKDALSRSDMVIMQTHAGISDEIIRGCVSDRVCDIAVRHHEKLDGSGYPRGLKARDLTVLQRIVAVADVLSALSTDRSYKRAFKKEEIVKIISSMSEKNKLDPTICGLVLENYDGIMAIASASCAPIIEKYKNMAREYEKLSSTWPKTHLVCEDGVEQSCAI